MPFRETGKAAMEERRACMITTGLLLRQGPPGGDGNSIVQVLNVEYDFDGKEQSSEVL
jgi:hypothetical protein